jgi:hypothetical protein
MSVHIRRPSLALRAFAGQSPVGDCYFRLTARNGRRTTLSLTTDHFVRFADRSSRGKKPVTRVLVTEI